ncbi:MAG: uncharacterized protein JWN86_4783 [Planctomycetota bacterium]|nr:uncharacterized protein [Planctomycetota bacterium]
MSKDIGPILAGWEHDPEEMQVRIIPGIDGREKLQMRIDLGLLQMEISGRPDGKTPQGGESLLDVLESQARKMAMEGEDFSLTPPQCAALMREGVQYYHRYIALFHLERYDLVARDTARNLRLFAFVVRHASRPRDRIQFDQYRPYVTMMHARALGLEAMERGAHREALEYIDEGIAGIRSFLRDYEHEEGEGDCQELTFLLGWRTQVEQDRPVGPVERLEQQLELAVATEDFEEAARIRDQVRRLREGGAGPMANPSDSASFA